MCQNMEGKEKRIETPMTQTGWEYLRPLHFRDHPTSLSSPYYLFICTVSFRQIILKQTECTLFWQESVLLHVASLSRLFNSMNLKCCFNKIKQVNVTSICNNSLHYIYRSMGATTDLCSVAWCWKRSFTVQLSKSLIENCCKYIQSM